MRASQPTSPRRFLLDAGASSAVEFALIFPVLLIFMMMGLQLVAYIEGTRKVERIAASVSEMISEENPPQGSSTALVTTTDLHFAYDSALVQFPYLMKDGPLQNMAWWQDIEIDFAGVQFTQIASNCTNPTDLSACYTPQLMWTSTIGTHMRQCAPPMTAAANTAATNNATLPKGVYGPGGLVVIDVYFTFHPTFASTLMPTIAIKRSAYVQPRYASLIKLNTTNNDQSAIACPGF